MNMKARMLGQPLCDIVMFMGAVVVYHQMQVQAMGKLDQACGETSDIPDVDDAAYTRR